MISKNIRFRRISAAMAVVTAAAAFAISIGGPGAAHAANDEPWREPPSCSNVTGTCASMEDILAYECFFDEGFVGNFCDDPLEALRMGGERGLVAPSNQPQAAKLIFPAVRR